MSRVIKAAIWEEAPCIIEVPPPPPPQKGKQNLILPDGEVDEQSVALQAELEANKKQADAERMLTATRLEMQNLIENTTKETERMLEQAKIDADTIKEESEAMKAEAEIMRQEAEALKAEIEKLREDMLAAAQAEIDEAKQKGEKDGYAEGLDKGYKEGTEKAYAEQRKAILDANEKAQKTISDAEAEKDAAVQHAEAEIVDLAIGVVNKILPEQFSDAPQKILPLVKTALLKIKDQSKIIVHVAPEHYDFVLMAKSEYQNMLTGNAVLEVQSDENLKPGDVLLESPNGDVDARLTTQLEQIKSALQDVIR